MNAPTPSSTIHTIATIAPIAPPESVSGEEELLSVSCTAEGRLCVADALLVELIVETGMVAEVVDELLEIVLLDEEDDDDELVGVTDDEDEDDDDGLVDVGLVVVAGGLNTVNDWDGLLPNIGSAVGLLL